MALAELVSKADLRTGHEAAEYAAEIGRIIRYLGVSDGNMQEGSLHDDLNICVRQRADAPFSSKVRHEQLTIFSRS